VLIWVAVYLANFNWAYQYFIWGLPFFLLAGRLREAVLLQLLVLLPAAEVYFRFDVSTLERFVIPLSLGTWLAFALAGWRLVVVAMRPDGGEPVALR